MATLNTPLVQVVLEQNGTDDMVELEVQTDNRDAIQWDVTRGRRSWPKTSDAPMLWATFLAWHAMKRTGAPELRGMSLDDFLAVCVAVNPIKRDGTAVPLGEATAEDFTVDPTSAATTAE
ncbi:hypothetical protein [Curtobacterium phage Penoan]|nr:hypothetical protein [Curtobacterium phage Penoan]